MRRLFPSKTVILLIFFNTLACSKAPSVRPLPGPSPLPIDSVRLGRTLGVEDFRKIHASLNREGKLNSLKPWFENVPEEDLKTLADIVSEELYETALDRDGLIQLLAERNTRKGFSDWREKKPLKNESLQRLFWSYLSYFDFAELLFQHTAFLDLDFQNTLQGLTQSTNSYMYSLQQEETVFNRSLLAKEVSTLLNNEEFKTEILGLTGTLSKQALLERLLWVFSDTKESNPKAFLAFSNALSSFSEGKLQQLLESLKDIDSKPEGLFSVASQYLKDYPTVKNEISLLVQPLIVREFIENTVDSLLSASKKSVTQDLLLTLPRKNLEELPTETFQTVRIKVAEALQENFQMDYAYDPENPSFDPLVNFYSYLVTRTLEENVRANSEKLSKVKEENIWRFPLVSEKINITVYSSAGKFDPQVEKDLKGLGLQDTTQFLLSAFTVGKFFSSREFLVKTETATSTLQDILTLAFDRAILIRPLTEPGVLLNAVLTRFDPAGLEEENLLTKVLSYASALSADNVDSFDKQFFHKMDLLKILSDNREIIDRVYEGHDKLIKKAQNLLDSLILLHELHHSGYEGVSGLALPWNYLNNIGGIPKLLPVFNKAFAVFRTSGIFKPENNKSELLKVFKNPNILAKYHFALGGLTETEMIFATTKFKRVDFNKNWELLKMLADQNPAEFESVLGNLLMEGTALLPTEQTLTAKERAWLIKFSNSKNFKKAVMLFNKYGSRENYSQMIKDLAGLSDRGDLAQALEFLSRLQNDRMQSIASTLLAMEKSKEMQELLLLLQAR